jgi:hypothetical protein
MPDMAVDSVGRLQQIGFEKAGRWSLQGDKPICALDIHGAACDVLYAFVSGSQVLYVGKSTRSLEKRMYGYQRPGRTQRTNIACNEDILKALAAERAIDIYVFRDPSPKLHAGIPINLAAGLEDGLIREFKPPWNKVGLG